MVTGPVQLLVLGFADLEPDGAILAELARLEETEVVDLLDLVVLRKGQDGAVELLDAGGGIIAGLLGIGQEEAAPEALLAAAGVANGGELTEEDFFYLDDAIPPGAAAAVAVVEHRWAAGLNDAVHARGGVHLADAWLHPADLAAVGLLSEDAADRR